MDKEGRREKSLKEIDSIVCVSSLYTMPFMKHFLLMTYECLQFSDLLSMD